jgi:hypothetical protein
MNVIHMIIYIAVYYLFRYLQSNSIFQDEQTETHTKTIKIAPLFLFYVVRGQVRNEARIPVQEQDTGGFVFSIERGLNVTERHHNLF